MQERFKTVLADGGKLNTLGRAGEVLQVVLSDHSRLDELFDCLSDEDAWVRMRAVDTFEKVCREHPEWAQPYIGKLLRDIAASDQPSIQWHLAEIFAEIELTAEERQQATEIMKRNIATTEVDWIVAANCIKTLTAFARQGFVSVSELITLLQVQQGHHSKSVVRKATQLLKELS
ncbi:hypothetical protein EYC58_01615 [Candidatus Saccharibacteria bacterium]|nr:MAG: hypothetical protein EYC58_01615 [Candidatus Saccharibacteria bacterium]